MNREGDVAHADEKTCSNRGSQQRLTQLKGALIHEWVLCFNPDCLMDIKNDADSAPTMAWTLPNTS